MHAMESMGMNDSSMDNKSMGDKGMHQGMSGAPMRAGKGEMK
jgi:hypothetical protein